MSFRSGVSVGYKGLSLSEGVPESVLLAGFGLANQAVARALIARGHTVRVFDDSPGPSARAVAAGLGLDLAVAPGHDRLVSLVNRAELVVPTPGLPESHPLLASAILGDTPVASEFDLALVWDQRRIAAVTGTNGKTTVTEMVVDALLASGITAMAAGNNDIPFVDAINRPDVEVFVVEASSFRLAHSHCFAPQAACWLNFAPDHLDVHRSLNAYEAAKARLWRNFVDGDIAVANLDDPVVMRRAPREGALCTFSVKGLASWYLHESKLFGPLGPVACVDELARSRPHDVANALAAAATATAVGATPEGLRQALRHYEPGPHRLQFVANIDGVEYYDDSKATSPHATVAALRGWEASVLVAGGHNKGLDLVTLTEAVDRIHAVVALGESADEIAEAFGGLRPVAHATDMDQAVRLAAAVAEPSMAVLLSPACASFDSYRDYNERGDDFARAVNELSRTSR